MVAYQEGYRRYRRRERHPPCVGQVPEALTHDPHGGAEQHPEEDEEDDFHPEGGE